MFLFGLPGSAASTSSSACLFSGAFAEDDLLFLHSVFFISASACFCAK